MIYILIIVGILLVVVGYSVYNQTFVSDENTQTSESENISNINDKIYQYIYQGINNLEINQEIFGKVRGEMQKSVFGIDYVINALIISLITENHIIISGYPGLAKTTIIKTFAELLGYDRGRIQGSVDLQPSDIVGNNIYNPSTNQLEIKIGPINHQLLLVDEINRMTPKTQSALLQAMAEGSITIDDKIYELPKPFVVLATMNPHDDYGTFPMTYANLDRFAMGIYIGYPNIESEKQILNKSENISNISDISDELRYNIYNLTYEQLQDIKSQINNVKISENLQDSIIKIIDNSRKDKSIKYGIGPRSTIYIGQICKAIARLQGNSEVQQSDIYMSLSYVLEHRTIGLDREDKIKNIHKWCK